MAELDLSDFLKDASVADLQWLDVDEEKYRAEAVLPKQNLDIGPDLEALWARNDEPATAYLIPNVVMVPNPGISDPHTMGDMSQVHGKLRPNAEEIAKVARLALMQSDDLGCVRSELTRRYPVETLVAHRDVIASVLQERGLVGRYYVVAEDFSGIDQVRAASFIDRYAPTARYVLSKTACGGCPHCHTAQPGGPGHCSQFNRQLVNDVPYTDKLAERVEAAQVARGRTIQASQGKSARERVRAAYLAPRPARSSAYTGQGVQQHKPAHSTPAQAREQLIEASALVKGKRAQERLAIEARPVVEFLHREMVKGLPHAELVSSLKLAFDKNLLVRTNPQWAPLLRESGVYGVIYTKQASFLDCHEGADFLAKHNPSVRAIVAGAKCGSCIYNKTRCMLYGKPLVKQAAEVLTPETVDVVLAEHHAAGRLPTWDVRTAASWGNPRQALKAIHEAVQASAGLAASAPMRLGVMTGFYGNTPEYAPSGVARKEIVKQASRYMNEGLYGQDLATALKSRFDPRDIVASKGELRKVLAEQGLQGIYYVDPSVYDDYGKGCDEVSRLHGSRGVPYLKYGSRCTSCVHQVKTGHCSKINKPLVAEPPYLDKVAQQRAVLASGSSTASTSYADLVNNGASMVQEFEMQNEIVVDVKASEAPRDVTIMFGQGKVKL